MVSRTLPIRWGDIPGRPTPVDLDRLDKLPSIDATTLPGTQTILGEHPAWDPGRRALIRVDIEGGIVLEHDPASGDRCIYRADGPVGAALPAGDGTLWVLGPDGLERAGRGPADPGPESPAPPDGMRFNDAGLAPDGVVWAGILPRVDPPIGDEPRGALVQIDARTGGDLVTVVSGMGCPNGIVWAADGATMLVCESDTRRIASASYGPEGARDWRIVMAFVGGDGAVPDGLEQAPDGRLWVAFWGLGAAVRFSPEGAPELVIRTDDLRTTSMCTGPDGTVWVTTASGLCTTPPGTARLHVAG